MDSTIPTMDILSGSLQMYQSQPYPEQEVI